MPSQGLRRGQNLLKQPRVSAWSWTAFQDNPACSYGPSCRHIDQLTDDSITRSISTEFASSPEIVTQGVARGVGSAGNKTHAYEMDAHEMHELGRCRGIFWPYLRRSYL